MEITLNKYMILDPRDRGILKSVMWDPWLKIGQDEEFGPYIELPCDDINPWATEKMMNLGFEWTQSRTHKR